MNNFHDDLKEKPKFKVVAKCPCCQERKELKVRMNSNIHYKATNADETKTTFLCIDCFKKIFDIKEDISND